MFVNLVIKNFRLYDDYAVKFGQGVNIIAGPNGCGKTSIVEALHVLATGKSFRGIDADMLKNGSDWFKLESGDRNYALKLTETGFDKKIEINERKFVRLTHNHRLPVVLFEPDHLNLLKGSPATRRDFIDSLLVRLWQDFAWGLHQFDRILLQRNNLLRAGLHQKELADQIFVWDIKLAEAASVVVEARLKLIESINKQLSDVYSSIAGIPSVITANYQSKVSIINYKEDLLKKLSDSLNLDVKRGFTGIGPQRDDIEFIIDDKPAGRAASRGETRTIVLALKMIELELLTKPDLPRPVLLLDDVFSELDATRQRTLAKKAEGYQTFITTTDISAVSGRLNRNYKLILPGVSS